MYSYSFEKLEVWKLAKDLCVYIYRLTAKFPSEEKFGMVSQMRRASVSIASNTAEGSSRMSKKDQSHFYTIAFSSTIELLNQLIISHALSFIYEDELEESRLKIEPITKGLSSLKRSTLIPTTTKP
ncbi:MAG: four helix bundle protein [Ginsengibacter sp.]